MMAGSDRAAKPAVKIDGLLNWIKTNSIAATMFATAGLLTPIVGFVQASNVVPFALQTLAIPDCYKSGARENRHGANTRAPVVPSASNSTKCIAPGTRSSWST